jgi:hypothetical protein
MPKNRAAENREALWRGSARDHGNRAAPGDREKAQTLLNEALESYERIGMPRHVEMARALLN